MEIISVTALKGGSGKTTTSTILAYALAQSGKKTLLIDLDPLASASTTWAADKQNHPHTIYNVFTRGNPLPISQCIVPTPHVNLHMVLANPNLNDIELELVSAYGRELILKKALETLEGQFEYVVIDNKPSMGILNANSLVAATKLIIPIDTNQYAMDALAKIWEIITGALQGLNPSLLDPAKIRILITKLNRAEEGSIQTAKVIQDAFKQHVFATIIRKNRSIEDAQGKLVTIFEYDKIRKRRSRGSEDYSELTKEVLNHELN